MKWRRKGTGRWMWWRSDASNMGRFYEVIPNHPPGEPMVYELVEKGPAGATCIGEHYESASDAKREAVKLENRLDELKQKVDHPHA